MVAGGLVLSYPVLESAIPSQKKQHISAANFRLKPGHDLRGLKPLRCEARGGRCHQWLW